MLRALTKIAICIAIGAGFGYFTANEWHKWHKKEVCEWKQIEPVKKPVTTADIRILDWTVKKCR